MTGEYHLAPSSSASRTYSRSPSYQQQPRSRSPSPSRSSHPYSPRYNLPPLRNIESSNGSGSPSLQHPSHSQLPRLVLKSPGQDQDQQPSHTLPSDILSTSRDSHSRHTSERGAVYSTLRGGSGGAGGGPSGSTSPADYVSSRGVQNLPEISRQRSYSGGSMSGRSASESGDSQASLPLGPMGMSGEGDAAGQRDADAPGEEDMRMEVGGKRVTAAEAEAVSALQLTEISREFRAAPAAPGWRDEEVDRTVSGGVTPGAVLPPIPRTTKVVSSTSTPTLVTAETPVKVVARTVGGSTAKSRKSSCDLCHHRKIRCDQGRPACGSCVRKGHRCVYAEDTEKPAMKLITATNRTITVVSATNPNETMVVEVPMPTLQDLPLPRRSKHNPSGTHHSQRYPNSTSTSSARASGPEWSAVRSSGIPTPTSGMEHVRSGGGDRYNNGDGYFSNGHGHGNGNGNGNGYRGGEGGERYRERDRMQMDFESDSEDRRYRRERERERGYDGRNSLNEDSADLAGGKQDGDGSDHDMGERGSVTPSLESAMRGSKRETGGEDELNGELLELAGGQPRKKKPRPSGADGSALPPLRIGPNSYRPQSGPPSATASGSRRNHPPTPSSWTDAYSSSISALMSSLPSADIQRILFDSFFTDPFLAEGITLLQTQFMEQLKTVTERQGQRSREGDATTLANAFAILGTALRIMPDETSRLLLASSTAGMYGHLQPKSLSRIISPQLASHLDPTPLDQRYFDLALICSQMAESGDTPSVMLVMLKLVLYRNLAMRKDRQTVSGQYLCGAIKIAQTMGLGKEWEWQPLGEREMKRRIMWSLYVADRHLSFETAVPYTLLEAHQGIHLPSPISEHDLHQLAPDATALPPHKTELGPTPCTALFLHTHLARKITPILDSFATLSPSKTPHGLVLGFDQSLDTFQEKLPTYMRFFPLTDTRWDSSHAYLSAHRIRLHARILAYRQGVHRSFIITYLRPSAPAGIRGVMAHICLSSLRTQRSAKMLDPKIAPRIYEPLVVFESAMILGLILYVDRAMTIGQGAAPAPEAMMWREGLANGVELLDNISAGVAGDAARKAVKVLREMSAKVDASPEETKLLVSDEEIPKSTTPSGSPGEAAPVLTSPPHPPHSRASSNSGSKQVQAVDTWLDGLAKERPTLEALLREPQWEEGWEKVMAGM